MKLIAPSAADGRASGQLAEDFRRAMRGTAATVTVVTTRDDGGRYGITATAATSVSLAPPSLIVCINQQGATNDHLAKARLFCVNVLKAGQEDVSRAFAGPLGPEERFRHGCWLESAEGIPYLKDAQTAIFCRVAGMVEFGTHTIFVGLVERVHVDSASLPLVYCDGRFGTLEAVPGGPNAASRSPGQRH